MLTGALQIVLFLFILVALTKPLGVYMARVFAGERTWLTPLFGPIERLILKLVGVREDDDQPWYRYAGAVLAFSAAAFLVTYLLLRLQHLLPLNSSGVGPEQMPSHLAFNIATSFVTNTNWQSYSPELTLSTFSNMVALAMQNWASAAVGIAVAVAVIRGFARHNAHGIGNFWTDLTRATLYVLLPICLLASIFFIWQGVPQTMSAQAIVTTRTIEGGEQRIMVGPVASQESIKHVGTNGGGIFNANSSHPFENPTPLSDLISKLLIFLIPAGLTATFGRMVGSSRQGWAIFAAMAVLFAAGAGLALVSESAGNPHFAAYGVERSNLEGKEARFGIGASTLFASVGTAASAGAVNSMHGSLTPGASFVTLFNMLTGEVIFGGVGVGLYGMLMYAILAVFIAGLMVGRTPEYLGKKIEKFEVQMVMLAVLILAGSVLGFTAVASTLDLPKDGAMASLNTWPGGAYGGADTALGATTGNLANSGPRGFSELLYSFASATGNNGSAMAGLTANTPIYNTMLGLAMLLGRFLVIIPMLAVAGAMARKKMIPASAGTLPTDNGTFVLLLIGVVLIVGALTFFPALSLGPVVEQFQMTQGVKS